MINRQISYADSGDEGDIDRHDKHPGEHKREQLMRKLPDDIEAANIFCGHVELLSTPLVAFVRLKNPVRLPDLPEIPVASRFFFFVLAPLDHSKEEIQSIAKCLGAMLTDPVKKISRIRILILKLKVKIDRFF